MLGNQSSMTVILCAAQTGNAVSRKNDARIIETNTLKLFFIITFPFLISKLLLGFVPQPNLQLFPVNDSLLQKTHEHPHGEPHNGEPQYRCEDQ